MNLYLLRHGIALEPGEFSGADGLRPLAPLGVERTRAAAAGFRRLAGPAERIVSSPLLRARQTAEIFAEILRCADGVETCECLAADREAGEALAWLKRQPLRNTLLVGHMPHLGRLAAALVWGRGDSPLALKKAGVCWLTFEAAPLAGTGQLECLLSPGVLRAAAEL